VQRLSMHQSQCYLAVGPFQGALKRRAGDAHAFGGLGLSKAFQVSQAQGLELVGQQPHLGEAAEGAPGRLVDGLWLSAGQDASLSRARHGGLALFPRPSMLTTRTAFCLFFAGVLAAGKVDDIGTDVLGDGLEFSAAQELAVEIEVHAGNGDDGETWLAGAFGDVAALTNIDLAHIELLPSLWWGRVMG